MSSSSCNLILSDKTIALRDYQTEIVDSLNNMDKPGHYLVVLATGLGKTVIMPFLKFEKRVLILSHRDELVHQPLRYFAACNRSCGVEMASEFSQGEEVVSASVQSLSRDSRLTKFAVDDFDLILVDEAHHVVAKSYQKVLNYFSGAQKVIGFTATPQRSDKQDLKDIFDDVVINLDLKWGITNKYLSPISWIRVRSDYDMTKIKKIGGDYSVNMLEHELNSTNNASVTARAYKELCYEDNRQTLIFCPTVSVAKNVLEKILDLIPDAADRVVIVTGDTDSVRRQMILDNYIAGIINCIVNVQVLTEGTDLPNTRAVIVDRPTCNPGLYTQIVGRGTRQYEGKTDCLVIDVVGKSYKSRKVYCAANLFELDIGNLSENLIDRLNGGNLMEKCATIIDSTADSNIDFNLLIETYDESLNNYKSIENKALLANNPLKCISKNYEEQFLSSDGDLYFGNDLLVRKTNEFKRLYKIQATYKGYIYISSPNIIGKCIISYDIPDDYSFRRHCTYNTSVPLPFQEAVNVVKVILERFFIKFKPKWHKSSMVGCHRYRISDKQCAYVHSLFPWASIEMIKELDSQDASNLIGFKTEERQCASQLNAYKKKYIPRESIKLYAHSDVVSMSLNETVSEELVTKIETIYKTLLANRVKPNLSCEALLDPKYKIVETTRDARIVIDVFKSLVNLNHFGCAIKVDLRALVSALRSRNCSLSANDFFVEYYYNME